MNHQLLTVQEVAEQLGLARITIRTWMAYRKIKYVKLGRAVRIPAAEVDRIIAAGTVPVRGER